MSVIYLNMQSAAPPDPYARCEDSCTHDLAQGVLLEDLLGEDGPYPAVWAQSGVGGWLPASELRARLTGRESAA